MTRSILTLLLILVSFSFLTVHAQDIPNASFEDWSGGEPVDWNTTNQNILGMQFNVVNKETVDPQSGLYSARVEVVTKNIPFVGAVTVPGVLTLSQLDIDVFAGTFNISGGYPFTGMPQQLAGYLKYIPAGTDTCYFGFALSRWNDNGTRDTIAYSSDTVSGSIPDWTPFQLPLAYNIWEAPDTLTILFLCTNVNDPVVHTGTKLYLDNLSFIYGTVGIEGLTFGKDYRIYADAASSELILETSFNSPRKLELSLIDLSGKTVSRKSVIATEGRTYLETSGMPAGVYVLRITEGNQMLDSRKVRLMK